MDGAAADQNTDFAISEVGILTFLKPGVFKITMRNSSVHDRGAELSTGASHGLEQAVVTTLPITVLQAGSQPG
jgi:hypothetical protein